MNHASYQRGWVSDLMYQFPCKPPTTDVCLFSGRCAARTGWLSAPRRVTLRSHPVEKRMDFRISALPAAHFEHLFGRADADLALQGARRMRADRSPGFPCRVSLEDAAPGEAVLLVNYEHLPADTPYRSRYAIFVREGARQAHPATNEVPQQLRQRLLSVRAFDAGHMLLDAEVTPGAALEPLMARLFAEPRVAYLHLHNAKPGCYAARVERA